MNRTWRKSFAALVSLTLAGCGQWGGGDIYEAGGRLFDEPQPAAGDFADFDDDGGAGCFDGAAGGDSGADVT